MKKTACLLMLILAAFFLITSNAETAPPNGQPQLEDILMSYAERETILSGQLQIMQNAVNFREAPGGKVLGRLQGGTILECLDETQYRGELWYHARSDEYGEGYVAGTFAKPVWNNMNWWQTREETGDVVSDNMLLFAYWMGSYQLDHGLSVVETFGTERQLSIAPKSVRGDLSVIPEDMKILLAEKLYEYGFICRNASYDRLADPETADEEKNSIAVSVLQKHYGTDDIWNIITRQSVVPFIHVSDLHARPEDPISGRDQTLGHAVIQRIMEEH